MKLHLLGLVIFTSISIFSCQNNEFKKNIEEPKTSNFSINSLLLEDTGNTKKVKGQLLYMPIYSNVPYFKSGRKFDLSAFVAIHNTDLKYPIKVTKVLYFDYLGNFVSNYITRDSIINPLATADFFIPEKDQSGTGANFLIEWVSDSLVNEPLVETVMLGLTSGQGISFSSTGKIIRERK